MLEPASEADHAAIVDLVNLAYRGHGAGAGWNVEVGVMVGPRTTLAFLREDLAAQSQAQLMVHRHSNKLVHACVWLEPLGEGVWYLGLMAIDPQLQAKGFGRRMLQASEAHIAQQNARRVRLSVLNVRGPLIAWYERRGYSRTGEIQPFPCGERRFGRPLRDDLAFVILDKTL